jgi:hypothetical protein
MTLLSKITQPVRERVQFAYPPGKNLPDEAKITCAAQCFSRPFQTGLSAVDLPIITRSIPESTMGRLLSLVFSFGDLLEDSKARLLGIRNRQWLQFHWGTERRNDFSNRLLAGGTLRQRRG